MAFHTVEDGPWPYGVTVSVWPASAVSGGVPTGTSVDDAVAQADGTVTFGGLTEGEDYVAFGSGGSQAFQAVNQESRLGSVETDVATKAGKPGTSVRRNIVFVSTAHGSDVNPGFDGLSWGTAYATVEAALAATPSGAQIWVEQGSYAPAATLQIDGHTLINVVRGGSNASLATSTIQHSFNGDLVKFVRGGGLHGFTLEQMGNFTGAAISGTSTTASRVGGIYVSDCIITGNSGHGFTRDVDLDGSADSTAGGPGLRQVFFTNCLFFGCKTTGETVRLNRVIHGYFTACVVVAAPEAGVTQGLKVLDTQTDDLHWQGHVQGNVSSEAAGAASFRYVGQIVGNLTWAASSARNYQEGIVTGTRTNSGGTSNQFCLMNNTFPQAIVFNSSIEVDNGISGPSGGRLKLYGFGGGSGIAEVYDTLSVSNRHSFGSFPNGGNGTIFASDALAVGDRSAGTVASKIYSGTGTPEGVVTGNIGDLFLRRDGGATTSLYVKTSGSGNTGWTGK